MAFADLRARHPSVELLQRSLRRGRLGHAYLLVGDDLELLEEVARSLAKVLNCVQPPVPGTADTGPDSCDRCSVCRRVGGGSHPDVWWVRPESKSRVIVIDQVREILHAMSLKPSEARTKLAIVVDADRMNPQAANAFLKTLEEPPGDSVLLLLSARPQNLLETIRSRCLILRFEAGPQRVPPGVSEWVAGFAGFAARPTSSLLGRYELLGRLLEQLGSVRSGVEAAFKARSPSEQQFEDAEAKLREKWEEELKAVVESEYRRQRSEFLAGLQWFFRDVWLRTLRVGEELLMLPKLGDPARQLAERTTPQDAYENLRLLRRAQRLLETNLHEALILEVTLLRLRM